MKPISFLIDVTHFYSAPMLKKKRANIERTSAASILVLVLYSTRGAQLILVEVTTLPAVIVSRINNARKTYKLCTFVKGNLFFAANNQIAIG